MIVVKEFDDELPAFEDLDLIEQRESTLPFSRLNADMDAETVLNVRIADFNCSRLGIVKNLRVYSDGIRENSARKISSEKSSGM